MSYVGVHFVCEAHLGELLIATLSIHSFDTFEETYHGFSAYCKELNFDLETIEAIVSQYLPMGSISYSCEDIPRINWNEEWEKNYSPVIIDDQIIVRAIFHPTQPLFPYEIIINPKMSFGTGHHSTTSLVLKMQLSFNHKKKKVYDFGSGTGVLAIMSHKLGASAIVATDIDDWCIENARENFQLNNCPGILMQGPIKSLSLTEPADIILANINKNVLLAELPEYAKLLSPEGHLILSGFYEQDIIELKEAAKKLALEFLEEETKNQWAVVVFKKAAW